MSIKMKFASANIIELVLDNRYLIKVYSVNNTIKAYSKDPQTIQEWSGLVLGLSYNIFPYSQKISLGIIKIFIKSNNS